MKIIATVCLVSVIHAGWAAGGPLDARPGEAIKSAPLARLSQAEQAGRYDGLILKHAQDHRLNPRLVKSIIAAEWGFFYGALSPKGARGLMQVMPATAEGLGVPRSKLREPDSNLSAGTAYLEVLCGRARVIFSLNAKGCSDAPLWVQQRIVAAYNAGPRMFHREPRRWPLATRLYVRAVFAYYRSPATVLLANAVQSDPYMLAKR